MTVVAFGTTGYECGLISSSPFSLFIVINTRLLFILISSLSLVSYLLRCSLFLSLSCLIFSAIPSFPVSFCNLRSSAFFVLGSAFCVLRSSFCVPPSAFRLLRSAFCVPRSSSLLRIITLHLFIPMGSSSPQLRSISVSHSPSLPFSRTWPFAVSYSVYHSERC